MRSRSAWCAAAAMCAVALTGAFGPEAKATTFATTDLGELTAGAAAMIQGTIIAVRVVQDEQGYPWTLYDLEVEQVLAGSYSGSVLGFRCVGGQVGNKYFELVDAPQFEVGDAIVYLHEEVGQCQVAGLAHGAFWLRRDERGTRRLVNHEGRAIAAWDEKGPWLSAQRVERPGRQRRNEERPPTGAADFEVPPAADADTLLTELQSFVRHHAQRTRRVHSTENLEGIAMVRPTRSRASQGGQQP
jgi:hypothetical protein